MTLLELLLKVIMVDTFDARMVFVGSSCMLCNSLRGAISFQTEVLNHQAIFGVYLSILVKSSHRNITFAVGTREIKKPSLFDLLIFAEDSGGPHVA